MDGIAIFSFLKFIANPGATNVRFKISATTIDTNYI